MIAPECEAEGAPPIVRDLGREGLRIWKENYPEIVSNGTLVVAHSRDSGDLLRFQNTTERHEAVDAKRIAALEPMLASRFDRGLYFPIEAHVVAQKALRWLLDEVRRLGADIVFDRSWKGDLADVTVDCRGM